MIWTPWGRRTEHAKQELREAREAQQEVIKKLEPQTKLTVSNVFRVKHENHLGETATRALGRGNGVC